MALMVKRRNTNKVVGSPYTANNQLYVSLLSMTWRYNLHS